MAVLRRSGDGSINMFPLFLRFKDDWRSSMVYLGDVHPIVSFIRKTGTSLTTITEDQDHRQF